MLLKGRLRAVADEMPAARLLLSGPRLAVLSTMQALATELPLLPPRATLAEEACAMARAEAVRPSRLGAPVLDPALSVEGALRFALGHLGEVLLWHAPVAHAGIRTEGVHQMRVAIRRLRSLLRVFRPACDGPALRNLDADAKAVADVLGPARDWDVFLGGLGEEVAAALPDEPRIAKLLRAARQKREAAYGALRPVLDGPALRRLAWDLVSVVETCPWREEDDPDAAERRALSLPDFAAGVLDKRWRRITEAGDDIEDLEDDAFHRLRIEAKRLRYASELFAPLWGRKRAKRFLGRLEEVQEAFGLANDAVVARSLTALIANQGGVALAWAGGVAEGWALARARRARRKAKVAWEAMVAGGAYWSQG